MKKIFFFFVPCIVFFTSCSHSENEKLIIGNWQGAEWLAADNPAAHNTAQTSFSFDDKGVYTFDYGSSKETGTYKIENEMLFTTPKGEREIMVKINKLTKDSLVFDMNRGGGDEQLTLIRK